MHVLLVEDDEDTRETLSYFLRHAGHDVRTAGNGLEALGAVRQEPPRIVLLDLVIPALNGYDVCRLIKEDLKRGDARRRLPVALLTARKVRDPRREGFIRDWTGADAVIYKPFGRRTLPAVMSQLLSPATTDITSAS